MTKFFESTTVQAIIIVAVIVLICIAAAAVYFWPAEKTAEEQTKDAIEKQQIAEVATAQAIQVQQAVDQVPPEKQPEVEAKAIEATNVAIEKQQEAKESIDLAAQKAIEEQNLSNAIIAQANIDAIKAKFDEDVKAATIAAVEQQVILPDQVSAGPMARIPSLNKRFLKQQAAQQSALKLNKPIGLLMQRNKNLGDIQKNIVANFSNRY